MAMRIVSCNGRPFAYAQDYDVHVWPQPHFNSLPAGSRAIDAFESDMTGRGHGTAFLRLLAERLRREGAPIVAIDPGVDNLRARRALKERASAAASSSKRARVPRSS
jgi:aminoglycoside 6'-N-acetyltransferase